MHALTVEAANWWARPRGDRSAGWIATYKNSLQTRHRGVISHIVGALGAASIVEVGCHCGPNLIRLATDHPTLTQLAGVDISQEAIEAGNIWAASLGLSDRIQLVTGRIPDASQTLVDRCVDVVLSCYSLAYQAPDDLDATLWEMGRLARKAVILAEPMTDKPRSESFRTLQGYQEWAHNYQAARAWLSTWKDMTIALYDVSPAVDRLASVLVATRTESSPSLDATA